MAYLQLIVPLVLILWLAVWPLRGRARWVHVVLVGAAVALIGLVGQWVWPTAYAPFGLMALVVLAVLLGRRRDVGRRQPRVVPGALAAIGAVAALAGVALAVEARLRPADMLDLTLPGAGRFVVTQGGNHWAINRHLAVNDADMPSLSGWRGQAFAVSLLPVDRFGRAGAAAVTVLAPCTGTVAAQGEDTRLGPYLVLDCTGIWVVLSGLTKVTATGEVTVGDAVGQGADMVIHAQSPGTAAHPFSGEPKWISLNGVFPVRGAVLGG